MLARLDASGVERGAREAKQAIAGIGSHCLMRFRAFLKQRVKARQCGPL
jgi:hypothetical protein